MNTNSLPQRGFIQGAIIFALALIAVIIAVLSSGTSDNADQLSREQAKQQAGQIISGGAKIYSGYLRAQADGLNPFQAGNSQLTNLVLPQPTGTSSSLNQWDLKKFSGFPKIDDVAFTGNNALPYFIQDIGEVTNSGFGTPGSVGNSACANTAACTLLVTLDGLKKGVCDAINLKMNKKPGGTLESVASGITSAAVSTTTPTTVITQLGQVSAAFEPGSGNLEGCYKKDSTNFTYFKALHVNWRL